MALTSDGKLYGWGWNKVIINVHLLFFMCHSVYLSKTTQGRLLLRGFVHDFRRPNIQSESLILCPSRKQFFICIGFYVAVIS